MGLSDSERRRLDALERRLAADDPLLAAYLVSGRRRRGPGPTAGRRRLPLRLAAIGGSIAVVALLLTAVWPAAIWGACVGTAAALTGVGMLVAHDLPGHPGNGQPP